ncbi:hypothetical protein SAZ11_08480 [Streptomyces sp. FXJ1.4098]|nr:hypothetical protein [Streptomyces sp. FXJ1.4098]
MIDPDAPLTAEKYRELHNIGDPATLARLAAEHASSQSAGDPTDGNDDDPTADPDYVPNPPYDLPVSVSSWREWCL